MRSRSLLVAALLSTFLAACEQPDSQDHEAIIANDLAEIISLQDLPCEKVVSWSLEHRFNYQVVCESGHEYVVHVSDEGHVNIAD